ncbi:MAG: hypothetical protein M1820_009872 [Bogoriella megaspora]|nr:MAG: hypothetical protein M1820_009872 [Bogoriella megaspora]
MQIVEKDSAILQYPKEISSPLHADHHTICKYRNLTDPNYVIVRNTLRYWIAKSVLEEVIAETKALSENDDRMTRIRNILRIRESAEDDLNRVKSRVMQGSYQWFVHSSDFVRWTMGDRKGDGTEIFWLFGLPATGKTALSSVVIDRISSIYGTCQYHFFSASHQTKRTAAYSLRTIASQLAQQHENSRERLFSFHEETGMRFTSQDQPFATIWEKVFEGIIFKIDFGRPIVWVFDAIDESDQQSLLTVALAKIRSVSPIKVLLSSRPMKVPIGTASFGSSILSFFLSEIHTMQDIRSYITNFIRGALPADKEVQQDVIDQVLTKASGSFLWVRLALESLEENWHTQEDILNALTDIPFGMVPLYQRMLTKVTSQPPKTQMLAQRILTWVCCSWRPLLIDEMKTALEPEFKGFVKFEETVQQICGHFVTVDNDRVSLIHATARQFLTEDRDGQPRYVNNSNGHQHIALRCLRYLSKDHWRRVFQRFSGPEQNYSTSPRTNRLLLAEEHHPLLGYATCYWAYHASKSPTDSDELLKVMKDFFENYSLLWIEAIALSANLRYITRSARYLKFYARQRDRKHLTSEILRSLRCDYDIIEPKWIQKWSNDLIRIVGKFGSSLVTSPASVYRNVAPFCPQGSMVGQTYGIPRDGLLSVSGLPSQEWDDCLATVSVGEDEVASRVLATETWFITLTSSGNIAIWHSETCELAREINVGEYVALFTLSQNGGLLAAASPSAYTVWEVSSGKKVHQIPKRSQVRTMAISFESDDLRFLIGSDDCSIAVYDLAEGHELARYLFFAPDANYEGCPKNFQISPDSTKAALAWRGQPPLIWHFRSNTHQSIQKCRTSGPTDPLWATESLIWQPDGSSLLILCLDTKVVAWNIFDDQQLGYTHLQARKMAVSHDMNLLLSYDNTGTITVWSFPRLTPLYKLVSENEFIRDITFSPDGQRIYDTRGSTCNVWEPEALVRPEEHELEDQSSIADVSFVSSEPVIAHFDSKESTITALAVSSDDKYYCCGRDNGSVEIHDLLKGKRLRKVYSHSSTSSVLSLAWSKSGRFVASGDDSARIIVKRLEVKDADKWAVYPVLDVHLAEPVRQLLFNTDEKLLLVSTSSSDYVYDVKQKQQICYYRLDSQQNRFWLHNPSYPSTVIKNSATYHQICDWRTLEVTRTVNVVPSTSDGHLSAPPTGHKPIVWATNAGERIIYGTLPGEDLLGSLSCLSHHGLHLESFQLSQLDSPLETVTQDCIPNFASRVKRLFGAFQGKVVFLDHDYWLCTWDAELGADGIRRHFFLPKNWVNANCLQMALVNDHGSFLCPRYGYVAVVRNGIRI